MYPLCGMNTDLDNLEDDTPEVIPFPSVEPAAPCFLCSHGNEESVGMSELNRHYNRHAGIVSDADLFRELARKYENETRRPVLAVTPDARMPALGPADFQRHFTRHIVSSQAVLRRELVTLGDIQDELLRHGIMTRDGIDIRVAQRFVDISKHKLNICRQLGNGREAADAGREETSRY